MHIGSISRACERIRKSSTSDKEDHRENAKVVGEIGASCNIIN